MSERGARTRGAKAAGVVPVAALLAVSLLSGAAMVAFQMPASSGLDAASSSASSAAVEESAGSASASAASSASSASGASSSDASSASSSASGGAAAGEVGSATLGEGSIASASADDARARNLAAAAEAIDGMVIQPGETFSFNDAVGDFSKDTRFDVAPEAAGGADGSSQAPQAVRGGGVCQVASALFAAAVRADLDVVERHAHEAPCDYVAVGLDAEVSYGKRDLRLRNTGDEPVVIRAEAQGQAVTVRVLGTARDDGMTYDIVAAAADEGAMAAGDGAGGAGDGEVVTETSKVAFSNGSKVSKEVLYNDTYRVNATSYIVDRGTAEVTK